MSLEIFTIEHGMENFSYVIRDKKTNKAAVIDPNFDAQAFIKILKETNAIFERIFLTHTHFDHINALDDLLSFYKPTLPVHISQKELDFWGRNDLNFITHSQEDIVHLGETKIRILFTSGHTIGHICLLTDKELFSGDTLFIYGCGHCRASGASPEELFHSLEKIKSLNDDLLVYSGHNYGDKATTTLAEQKKGNPFLKFSTKEKFIRYRMIGHNRSTPYTAIYD